MRKSTGHYPANWKQIAAVVKGCAGWCCVRCGHSHDIPAGFMLTVHHIDLNCSNCAWYNIPALCQKCHLVIQHKVIIDRPWMFDHTLWFRPYVAGYYAARFELIPVTFNYWESLLSLPQVLNHQDQYIELARAELFSYTQ